MKTLFYDHLNTYKMYYFFNLGVLIGGLIFGLYYINFENPTDISTISSNLIEILEGQYIQNQSFVSYHLIDTLTTILIIYILSLSLVAIPILPCILFYKSMQIGFTAALYLQTFNSKGILGILITILPYILFEMIAYFTSFAIAYEVSLSIVLTSFIRKQTLNFKEVFKHIINNLLWSLCFVTLSVLTQIYILPFLFKIFVR